MRKPDSNGLRLTRRRLLYLAAAGTAGCLLASCSSQAQTPPSRQNAASGAPASSPAASGGSLANLQTAKTEGNVVGYVVLVDSQIAALKDLYQKKVGASLETFSGAAPQVISRLTTEKNAGRNIVDFVAFDSSYMDTVASQGLLDKMPQSLLTRVPEKWRNPDGYYVIYSIYPATIIYNTQLVPESAAPKSLQDLLDPKWKGKIAISDPSLNPIFLAWFYAIRKDMGEEKAKAFFNGLGAQNPTLFEGGVTVSTNVNQGQFPLGLSYMTHTLSVGGPNGHMGYVKLDPMWAGKLAVAQVAHPPHPESAKALLDIFLGPDFLQASGNLGYPITVPGVKSAIPGADQLHYEPMPNLTKAQTDDMLAYVKAAFRK